MASLIYIDKNGDEIPVFDMAEDGLPIFSVLPSKSSQPKDGFLAMWVNSGSLPRASFPQAWAEIQRMIDAGDPDVLSDEEWFADVRNKGFCNKFSRGDEETTFRIPFIPLEFSYSTMRIRTTEPLFTTPTPTPTTGAEVIIYQDIAPQDIFVVVSGYIKISANVSGLSLLVDGVCISNSKSSSSQTLVICSGYVSQGKTFVVKGTNVGSNTSGVPGYIEVYAVDSPIEYPFLKMYSTLVDNGEVSVGELVQQAVSSAVQASSFVDEARTEAKNLSAAISPSEHSIPLDIFQNNILQKDTVTAPGNGWIIYEAKATGTSKTCIELVGRVRSASYGYNMKDGWHRIYIPVAEGEEVAITNIAIDVASQVLEFRKSMGGDITV